MEPLLPMKVLGPKSFNQLIVRSRFTFLLAILLGIASEIAYSAVTVESLEYIRATNPGVNGIGYVADGKSLYLGGCQVFDLESKSTRSGCRYPLNTRWGSVSPDGTLVLATTIDPKTKESTSFQLDAVSGKVHSSKRGIHFAPPIAIHPSNRFWVGAQAGRTSSTSETLVVIDRGWHTSKDKIYVNTQRIFSIAFTADGSELIVNSGNSIDGAKVWTATWQVSSQPIGTENAEVSGILIKSADNRVGVRLESGALALIDLHDGNVVALLDLDMTEGEPELAFSPDGRKFAAKGYRLVDGRRQFGAVLVQFGK